MSSYKDATSKNAVAFSNTSSVASEHLIGRVKWFNNKAGYGFITVTDGSRSGSDIFVHHSAINVENQQYKYLVQGEYVEFDLVKTESQTHEWQASKVDGIKGGKLMCETRRDLKLARNEYKTTKTQDETVTEQKMPRQRAPREAEKESSAPRQRKTSAPKARGEDPRESRETSGDKKEWTLVTRGNPQKGRSRAPRQAATVITIQSK
jgi:CspA family cold shock protein